MAGHGRGACRNNLYVAWSTMKSVLGRRPSSRDAPCPYVESVGGVCQRSSRHCAIGHRRVRGGPDSRRGRQRPTRDIGRAIEPTSVSRNLYRGDLLPGDVYDDWFAASATTIGLSSSTRCCGQHSFSVDGDGPGNALVFARRAIQADSLREDLYQMRAALSRSQAGQRSSAIDTYFHCRDRLAEELGSGPLG